MKDEMSQIETPEHLKIKRYWEEHNKLCNGFSFYFEEDEMSAQDLIDSVGNEIL